MSIGAAVEGGRRLIEGSFLDRCVILDVTEEADGSGGTTTTYTPRALDVPCRFTALTETDVRVVAGSAYGAATATCQVSVDLQVPEGAYVQNVDHDDAFWLVVGDRTPPSATATVRRLLVREASWR
jgi:hypothetical protein